MSSYICSTNGMTTDWSHRVHFLWLLPSWCHGDIENKCGDETRHAWFIPLLSIYSINIKSQRFVNVFNTKKCSFMKDQISMYHNVQNSKSFWILTIITHLLSTLALFYMSKITHWPLRVACSTETQCFITSSKKSQCDSEAPKDGHLRSPLSASGLRMLTALLTAQLNPISSQETLWIGGAPHFSLQ